MRERKRPSLLGEPLTDSLLSEGMHCRANLGFLKDKTFQALVPQLGDDLSEKREGLLKIWPDILTDAIFGLKKADEREYQPDSALDADSLFDRYSLGVEDLQQLLRAFRDFEPMLYGASEERYRDHVAHPFRVWMLGHLVLDECLDWNLQPQPQIGREISKTEWMCMWALVALCHDIGYPLAGVEAINRTARHAIGPLGLRPVGDLQFAFSQQMLPFHDAVIRMLASALVPQGENTALTHLQNKYYLKYLKSFDRLDHGIVSALLIARSLVYFLESDLCHDSLKPLGEADACQFLIRREILRAIASHTCLDIYHLCFDTLSFVLYLMDELQGWGRPTLAEAMRARIETPEEQEAFIHEFSGNSVSVEVRFPPGDWKAAYGDNGQPGWLCSSLNRFHRIVRLAVDTKSAPGLKLCVKYRPKSGCHGASIQLANGKIVKKPEKWFR